MKPTFFARVILPVLALGVTALQSAFADAATNAPANPAPPASAIDNDDMTRLVKVREQVLATHPDLKAEEEKLKAMHEAAKGQNPPPTAEQKSAAIAEWKAYQTKIRAAMLKIDPTLSPIFARLDASHKHAAP